MLILKIRKQSKQEIKYAKKLAGKYNKICYTTTYTLDKFSEKTAREFRYSFFTYTYSSLFWEYLQKGSSISLSVL